MSRTDETPTAGQVPELTVYYDGACPLCRAEIGHYSRCRGAERVAFVDVSDVAADPGPDLPREAALARFHVRDARGGLVSGAAGFARLWRVLPAWRPAAAIARLPGVRTLLELAYRGFLPLRPHLARMLERRARRHSEP
ncbi:thiol-disulfide oxidoreductase DCC family protein [Salinarimonas chemoclinalis]|uniref:thiol-disulfide oxidoreductase DCC family protein n=1 Tax=Salinarimonas chemoclinalis TaxID=3241599 RepID=UPI0035580133